MQSESGDEIIVLGLIKWIGGGKGIKLDPWLLIRRSRVPSPSSLVSRQPERVGLGFANRLGIS